MRSCIMMECIWMNLWGFTRIATAYLIGFCHNSWINGFCDLKNIHPMDHPTYGWNCFIERSRLHPEIHIFIHSISHIQKREIFDRSGGPVSSWAFHFLLRFNRRYPFDRMCYVNSAHSLPLPLLLMLFSFSNFLCVWINVELSLGMDLE